MRSVTVSKAQSPSILSVDTAQWLAAWGASWRGRLPKIEFSSYLSTSLGISYPERAIIRLNTSLLGEDADLLQVVLCHELAHIVIYKRHGVSARPHGFEWQALMRAAGFEPHSRIGSARRVSKGATRRYRHVCSRCNAIRLAGRPMPQWRCGRCVTQGLDGVLLIESAK